MSVKIDRVTLSFILICFISMAIPYVLGLGGENVFIKDFYAKRFMTLLGVPFFLLVILYSFRQDRFFLNSKILWYLLIYIIVFVISILSKNRLQLIITDAFIAALPVIFFFCVNKAGFDVNRFLSNFNVLLVLAGAFVIFGVKLQFSYLSLLSIIYLIFFIRWNKPEILLIVFLPFLLFQSLIGKSALLMLLFLVFYFFVFDKSLVSTKKKLYLLIIPSSAFLLLLIVFWSQIQSTGSYRNFVYFLSNADFSSFSFRDHSTGHRLFEAQRVLEEYRGAGFSKKLFGHGFGATIDLSGTPDATIASANDNIKAVRNIHMGIFAVLYRYGLVGLVVYLVFMLRMAISCIRVLKRSSQKAVVLSALYILVLLFDSLISFPHMMSNFLFWLLAHIVFMKEKTLMTATKKTGGQES